MGWGRMFLMGDFGQQLDIQEMSRVIDQQQSRDASQDESIASLQRENRELQLAVASLARLLVQKGVVTQAEVQEIGRAMER